jgi:hypothetical protein
VGGVAVSGEVVVATPSNVRVSDASSALSAAGLASGALSMAETMRFGGSSSLVAFFLTACGVAALWWRRQRAAAAAHAKLAKIPASRLQLQPSSPRTKPLSPALKSQSPKKAVPGGPNVFHVTNPLSSPKKSLKISERAISPRK